MIHNKKKLGLADNSLRQKSATFLSMVRKHLVEESRYPISFVVGFLTIFLMIFMFIFAAATFAPPQAGNKTGIGNVISGSLPSVMMYGFIIFMLTTQIVSGMIWEIRWEQVRGTLETVYLSPANKFNYLLAKIFASFIVTGIMSLIAIFSLYYIMGGMRSDNLALALYILLMTVTGTIGLGFVFAGATIIGKQTANMLANFSQFFFMIFCAMFFPFKVLPAPVVDYICRVIPLSYCVDSFRSVLAGLPAGYPELLPLNLELIIVTAWGILTPIIGYIVYKKIEKSARIKGTLGEF